MLHPGPDLTCRFGPLFLDVVPAGVAGHVLSLRVAAGTVGGDGAGSGDLVAFVIALFAQCCEQDDSPVGVESFSRLSSARR